MRNHGLEWAPYILETTISVPWKLVKHEAYPFNQHLIQWNLARFSLVLSGPLTLLSPAKHGRSEATHVEGCKVPTASNRLRRVEIDCYYSLLFWWLIWNPISKKNFSAAVDFDIFEYTKMKPPETNFHHLSGLQPLRGGENLVFDPGRTQRRSAQGRRAVSAMCNVELPNNAGKTLENPGNSTQNLGCVVVSSVFIFWVVVGKNAKIIQ